MTDRVQAFLIETIIRNLREFAKSDIIDADEAGELEVIADRFENGTQTEADWIEAIQQLDING